MRHTTADAQYQALCANVEAQGVKLAAALTAHASKQAKDARNYGYVGDLAEVEAKLAEALRLLGA
jgi:hypothetical protein